MKTYTDFLFDLDGTLTDPSEGITKCIAYALDGANIPTRQLDDWKPFIGPPLKDTFMHHFQLDEAQSQACILRYRERFTSVGLYENKLLAGVPELLEMIKSKGGRIYLATSKPEVFALRILQHFHIFSFFDLVAGSLLDDTRPTKTHVLQHILTKKSFSIRNAVMIGDREHDIHAARNLQIDTIGVLCGFGSREELELAGADRIVQGIPELHSSICSVYEC